MGNAFSKSSRGTGFHDRGSDFIDVVDVEVPVEIEENGVVTTHIETKRVNMREYAESLGLPTSDQYMLRDMLKSGFVPEAVNVHGILDNPDVSDTEERDALLDRILSFKGKADKPASEVVEEAAQVASQAVEEIKND